MESRQIVKRDGRIESWSTKRIGDAIFKAFQASGIKDRLMADRLAKKVEHNVFKNGESSVEQEFVQDRVESVLMKSGFEDVARRYIIYREQRRAARSMNMTYMLNAKDIIETYQDRSDWRVNENANMGQSLAGLILHIQGEGQKNYMLNKVYTKEIRESHTNGYFHIHDLTFGLTGYCSGWSTRDLLMDGFHIANSCAAGPAKHLSAIMGQCVNFLGTLQNEWAGAQALNNFDTYLAPFIRLENLTYSQVKQIIQNFVHSMNTNSRWGSQSPFTNLTFDMKCPKHMENEPIIVGGEYQDTTYGEYQVEMDIFNKAFIEVLMKGDYHGRIFSFPIPTYNVTKDFPWDSENVNMLMEMTAKYGIPYFQNFINSDLNPEDVRSMCCRLQMDLREIRKKTGGLFGAGDLTGSIGVVTLNLSKLAYLSQDEYEFMELVTEYANLAKNSLEIKRKYIQTQLDVGQMPWTRKYLKNGYKGHFSTIGINAGHEACMNLLGKGIDTPEGTALMVKVLNHLRELTKQYQEETGNLYNLESSPAEGVSYRLAKIDKELYGSSIYTSGSPEAPYYTNSTNLPVNYTTDIFTALEHQNKLQPLYTGGTVFHSFLGEALPNAESVKNFLRKAMSMTKIPYISITPTFSICSEHGYLVGEHYSCPHCNKDTEVYSRIVGYYRPISRWNKGKVSEWNDRKEYKIIPSTLLKDVHEKLIKEITSKPLVTNIVNGELV